MSANETVILPEAVEHFVNAFKSIGGGTLSDQTAKNMAKAIKATMVEGKKSTVTIKLEVSKTNEELIMIAGETKVNVPTPKITGAFFVNQQYLPTRNRPDQMVMTFDNK